ncbi:MAG: hypothetical protein K6G22_14960 [Lachnospiraceae bacterium]|nr:hypothetical protein [Lachnospiraceae bacterium]
MTKLLFFPFYLTFKLIELPFKFVWWCFKTSIKLSIAISVAAFVFILLMFIL